MGRLEGKTAVITGAGSGIGLAAARRFGEEGANVLAIDINGAGFEDRLGEIPRATGHVADVTVAEEVEAAMARATDLFGGIDVVLPNAGIFGEQAPIEDFPLDNFSHVLDVNVRGVLATMKYATPYLISRGGGSIVITSSVAAVIGNPGVVAYIASKHALTGIMKVAARELAPHGIRVNTVNPGLVDTPMLRGIEAQICPDDSARGREILFDATLLKRFVQPGEVSSFTGPWSAFGSSKAGRRSSSWPRSSPGFCTSTSVRRP
jgi:NAD(P)-dependent dehydrogenase (short-subunit alcohol dehydrogenase family)